MKKFVEISEKHQANGFISGLYIAGKEFHKGELLIPEEGQHFPFTLSSRLVSWIKKNPQVLQSKALYQVWPNQLKGASDQLSFHAIKVCPSVDTFRFSDWFSIRGQLWDWDEKKRSLRIKIVRNADSPPPRGKRNSFYLEVKGSLPCNKYRGELWEMQCVREGNNFIVSNPIKISKPKTAGTHPVKSQIKLAQERSTVRGVAAIPLYGGL
jgi:hypothetical protein